MLKCASPIVYMETPEQRFVAATEPIGELFSKSWQLFCANWKLQAGASAIVLLIYIGIQAIPGLGQLIGFVLFGPLWSGLSLMSLNLVRQKPAAFSDAFAGFGPQFVSLALVGMVFKILVLIGLLLLILPGIYLAVAWSFPFLLAIDRNLPFWTAMETSRKTVHPRWAWFFLLWVISILLMIAGGLAFVVGLILAMPLVNNAFAIVYNKTFPVEPAPATESNLTV